MKRFIWFSLLAGLAMLLVACGTQGATPDASGEITIIQEDSEEGMNFNPETITLTAGQKVRIILENRGAKDHEFMIGRNVAYTESGAPNGFEEDFFEGIEDLVQVQAGEGVMLMIDGQTVMTGGMETGEGMQMEGGTQEMPGMDMGEATQETPGMEMGEAEEAPHIGWMIMSASGSERSIIEFTVPEDRVGEWEMGCFEDKGSHYEDGMRGKLIVVGP